MGMPCMPHDMRRSQQVWLICFTHCCRTTILQRPCTTHARNLAQVCVRLPALLGLNSCSLYSAPLA